MSNDVFVHVIQIVVALVTIDWCFVFSYPGTLFDVSCSSICLYLLVSLHSSLMCFSVVVWFVRAELLMSIVVLVVRTFSFRFVCCLCLFYVPRVLF